MSTLTPRTLVSPKDAGTSPTSNSNGVGDQRDDDDDGWSAEDDDDHVGADGSRKRKRPMSVSCELCKQRKACHHPFPSLLSSIHHSTATFLHMLHTYHVLTTPPTGQVRSWTAVVWLVSAQRPGLRVQRAQETRSSRRLWQGARSTSR